MTNVQVTVDTLVAHAQKCGVDYAAGVVATSNGFDSARLLALAPAIAAFEANDMTCKDDEFTGLAGKITRAYADGSKKPYKNAASEGAAVSKTASFLIVASRKLATPIINEVKRIIATQNDDKVAAKMSKGIFEKLYEINRFTIASKNVMPESHIIAGILSPTEKNDTDAELAALFKKIYTALDGTAKIGGERYEALSTEARKYERLAKHHKAQSEKTEAQRKLDAQEEAALQARLEQAGLTLQSKPAEVAGPVEVTDDITDPADAAIAAELKLLEIAANEHDMELA